MKSEEQFKSVRHALAEFTKEMGQDEEEDLEDELGLVESILRDMLAKAMVKVGASTLVEAPEAEPASLRLRWPRPSLVNVIEEVDQGGASARLRYMANTRAASEADETEVELTDFRFLELMGEDPSTPEMQLRIGRARSMAETIPSLRIAPSGALLGFGDVSAMLSQMHTLEMDMTEGDVRRLHPQLAKYWYAWCASWLSLPVVGPDQSGTVGGRLLVPGHEDLPVSIDWSCSAPEELHGYWWLTQEVAVSTDNPVPGLVTAAMDVFGADYAVDDDDERSAATELLAGLLREPWRIDRRIDLVLDPSRMIPVHVARCVAARLDVDVPTAHHELQFWDLDWGGDDEAPPRPGPSG